MKNSKRHRVPPDIVKYFGNLVESWEQYPMGYLYLKLRNLSFDEILVKTIPVGLDLIPVDVKYSFTCEVEVVPEDKMNDKYRELYRRLKSAECKLSWKGKLWKKGFFTPIPNDIQTCILQMKSSDELIDILHANKDIMKLINKIKPEELSLKLYAGVNITKSIESANNFQMDFYSNPLKIAWIINLVEGRYITSTNPYKLTADICSLLDLITKELRDLIY
jgi:hypothetical protein